MRLKFETIKQIVVIDARPADVYEAYVNPEKHSEFTGSPASGKARVGGRFTAWDGYITGRFLKLEKDRRVIQEWTTSEWPEGYPPSKVEITFEPVRNKTRLTMLHSKVPAEQAESYAQGWTDWYWGPLKRYLKK